MNLVDVMDQLGDALDEISGLRVWRYPPGSITPPAAVVGWPETLELETAYQQGAASMTIPIVVLEGKVSERSSALRLGAYAAGTGAKSIKAAIDDYASYTALDVATVRRVEFDIYTVAAVDHLAAVFDVDIIGSGT